jgi:amino acid adenylation domain-containing protein
MTDFADPSAGTLLPSDKGVPLSFAQEQLWFIDQLTPGATTYHISVINRLRGPLRIDVLQEALTQMVARHDSLRMTFHSAEGIPFQVVSPPDRIELPVHLLNGSDGQDEEQLIRGKLHELISVPFDLERGPMYRYELLKVADDDHVFVQLWHHIVTDGWSAGVMHHETNLAYRAILEGREPDFGEPATSYSEYATEQREQLQGEALTEELDWWTERLANLPTLVFPADRPRPAEPSRGGGSIIRPFPSELLTQLRALAKEHGVSLYMTIVSALNVLLSQYTGQEDIPVGVAMLNRMDEDMERVVGLFVNMVVLRTDLSGDPTFSELLERVLEANLDLYEHQEVPFNLIVDKVQPVRAAGINPLFQIATQLLGGATSGAGLDLPGVTATSIAQATTGSRFDMAVDFVEEEDSLTGLVEYSYDLFDEWRIRAMLNHLESILTAAVSDPSVKLSELPLLSSAERDELLALGKGETTAYSADPLHKSVERFAGERPDSVAVVCRGVELSYGELNRRGDKLARYLRTLGVEAGQIVGILLDREMDAFVAEVAVLKIGCAFVVLDPKLPVARLDLMIRDTATPVVLTRSVFADVLPERSDSWVPVILDTDWEKIEAGDDQAPLPELATSESLAYVLYTSGSTGMPKGVLIRHQAVSVFLEAFRHSFGFEPTDRLLQLPALNFDMSQGEIWMAFQLGATLVAVSPEDVQSPEALSTLMREQKVSYAALPLAMQSLLDSPSFPDLKYIVGGAEALDPVLVNKWNLPGRTFLNLYGPTECAIAQTEYKVDHIEWKTSPPIGYPHRNRQVYIVGRYNNLVPKGVNGELIIGGDEGGLALGYLNQPDLTAQKFVVDPFNPSSKVYRTGDLVRWNAAGQIEFLGRIDTQVKLRGLRVELGEIEIALQSHPGVRRAVVLMRPDRHGENRLIAYYISEGEPPRVEELRRFLGESLPDYMVPTAWLVLEQFPMNLDGWKVNRNALPTPDNDADGDDDAEVLAPRTPTEEEVARCFAEVLDLIRVGAEDSFFDRGGNSLQALRVVGRLSKTFGVKLRVRLLYSNQTVAMLSAAIDGLTGAKVAG